MIQLFVLLPFWLPLLRVKRSLLDLLHARILMFCTAAALLTSACGLPSLPGDNSGDGGAASQAEPTVIASADGANGTVSSTATMKAAAAPKETQGTWEDSARFLSQASFGPVDASEIDQVRTTGYDQWLSHQFALAAPSHLAYVTQQSPRETDGKPRDEMSYEAIWQQWLYSEAQLRSRVAFALSQIFVISNVAPDLNAQGMSSYLDMINAHAFDNYRNLLEQVTLHPAMGYYLNMIESEKEDPAKGTHPNENYPREVLQLFSIGLVKLNPDGSVMKDANGVAIPTYDQKVVEGFAKAFSGWSFGGRDTSKNDQFHNGEEAWTTPMQAWAGKHSTSAKTLLDGRVLSPGQTPQQDMTAALDSIFLHPNVPPFISRRLIQRLVTSNPSPEYIGRVAAVFTNNGSGVRGDLKSLVRAILLDPEARATPAGNFGKQREPVIRLANMLRVMNAKSKSGHTDIHYLDSADNALGQSPLLSPSVFNFFSPDFKNPGPIAAAGLYSPEFQITTETTVVGTLNFFSRLIKDGGYGSGENRVELDFAKFDAIAADAGTLIDHFNALFMNGSMLPATRTSFLRAINSIDPKNRKDRIKIALALVVISPEFVIQR